MDPLTGAMAGLGIGGGLFQGMENSGVQKKLMDEQLRLARSQYGQYLQNVPMYQQALQQYAGMANLPGYAGSNAGYGSAGWTSGTTKGGQQYGMFGSRRTAPGGSNAMVNYSGTPNDGWNLGALDTQAMQARQAAAEESLSRQTQAADAQYRQQGALMGLSSGSIAGGLAQQHESALENYAGYRRGLAMQAGDIQAQRLGSLMGALGPGFQLGQQGSATLGQQAGQYGALAQQGFGAVGQTLGNLQQYQMMNQYLNALPYMGYGTQGAPGGIGLPMNLPGAMSMMGGMGGQSGLGITNGLTMDANGQLTF